MCMDVYVYSDIYVEIYMHAYTYMYLYVYYVYSTSMLVWWASV
jgi:hypothetical protein